MIIEKKTVHETISLFVYQGLILQNKDIIIIIIIRDYGMNKQLDQCFPMGYNYFCMPKLQWQV